jgi:hypothetical protein
MYPFTNRSRNPTELKVIVSLATCQADVRGNADGSTLLALGFELGDPVAVIHFWLKTICPGSRRRAASVNLWFPAGIAWAVASK